MDVRGIEVTNQLRSAIRAKLLELGVRYDEELPDYILVMVVNKKSRQQMHDDLFLFLEDSTTPFVDWLHDQVLKKLQKVTVAKKKASRDLVPSVVVKHEEERKKRKTATSFLEDQTSNKSLKDDKNLVKDSVQLMPNDAERNVTEPEINIETSHRIAETAENRLPSIEEITQIISQDKQCEPSNEKVTLKATEFDKISEPKSFSPSKSSTHSIKKSDQSVRNIRRSEEGSKDKESEEEKCNEKKDKEKDKEYVNEESSGKLKSSVIKPKITSVVSVKNRLGATSPRRKFESSRDRASFNNRYRQSDKRPARNSSEHRISSERRNNFSRGRNFNSSFRATSEVDSTKRNNSDLRSRIGNTNSSQDTRDNRKEKSADVSIKDRLGLNNLKSQKSSVKQEVENSKCFGIRESVTGKSRNIKNRLGPVRNNFRVVNANNFKPRSDEGNNSIDAVAQENEEEEEEDEEEVPASMKSHIIAVNRGPINDKKNASDKQGKEDEEEEEEETADCKVPSKIIVTPRPLKPLQPAQKRATQSLLLRAVAEANQSVVMQKNPEPSLTEKRPAPKRLRPLGPCQVGNNLSVHLNETNRFVMEKIQIQVTTKDTRNVETKSHKMQEVTDEHMGVVMSLFQRGDDSQKFLVTLNGYNNNVHKENSDEEEEGLEMEVNEEDEITLANSHSDMYLSEETNLNDSTCDNPSDHSANDAQNTLRGEDNNENQNTENVENTEDIPRKKRKLSPIVYNRSPTPTELKSTKLRITLPQKHKKPMTDSNVLVSDKNQEKCRYWPNCTSGSKCVYYHPEIPCSAFPACKYGDKCAYKHPKCKFGIACTKLGCVFSHPSQQCKYYPFCTKPACPYSHPPVSTVLPTTEISKQRAKFTWKRQE